MEEAQEALQVQEEDNRVAETASSMDLLGLGQAPQAQPLQHSAGGGADQCEPGQDLASAVSAGAGAGAGAGSSLDLLGLNGNPVGGLQQQAQPEEQKEGETETANLLGL